MKNMSFIKIVICVFGKTFLLSQYCLIDSNWLIRAFTRLDSEKSLTKFVPQNSRSKRLFGYYALKKPQFYFFRNSRPKQPLQTLSLIPPNNCHMHRPNYHDLTMAHPWCANPGQGSHDPPSIICHVTRFSVAIRDGPNCERHGFLHHC